MAHSFDILRMATNPLPPIAIGLRQRRDAKNRRRAVVYVIPRLANNLYNRPSAVDSLIHNQPQVGKPTWGYDYTTVLRRLPIPSKKTRHHHRFAPTAQCGKNRRRAVSYVSTGLACLPRDTNPFASTAEERLYMSSPDLQIIYTTALRR